jgi:hypothetical protein
MAAVEWAVRLFLAYLAVGFLFATVFAAFGVQRVDTAANGSGPGFRLLVMPGAVAFWPLLLGRWIRSGS